MAQDYHYDILVVGGGHAGVEAAYVCARRGYPTALLTMQRDNIGVMSCNPAIGGLAKGQVVREIDALGGLMAEVIDATGIQFRMLNVSKGPAVWAPRAQADRELYSAEMQRRIENQPNLDVCEELVEDLIVTDGKATGLICESGTIYRGKAVIIATGTFLQGLMHIGTEQIVGGRHGERAASKLSKTLLAHGLELGRLKTGTPPRVDRDSIDFTQMDVQEGDNPPPRFSFKTTSIDRPQVQCYSTYTNLETHRILLDNLNRSPMYSGQIQSIGPRYCPSVEDKVVRFKDKPRHQIILEPEGLNTNVMYMNGFSTSMPREVQEEAMRTIPGYENVNIIRYGYAVEYDYIPPVQLTPWLETKTIKNLYLAGQVNGTSGYEEAAGQGLIAGINAVQGLRNGDFFILDRSEAYIGVMIDDLVTKEIDEPYRLLTSRSEYRLQLRQDNADLRLMDYGWEFGLIDADVYEAFCEKRAKIKETKSQLTTFMVLPEQANPFLVQVGSSAIKEKTPLSDVARRPEVGFRGIQELGFFPDVNGDVAFQVDLALKYEGYIARQNREIERYSQMEKRRIPDAFDYDAVQGLSTEGRTKLKAFRPVSIGQAGRIAGITPADISVLLFALSRKKNNRQ